MTRIILFFFCCFYFQAEAQYTSGKTYPDPSIQIIEDLSLPQVKYSKELNKEDIQVHLNILASDEYEGRETGEKGIDMAADYISKHFKTIGLKSKNKSYYQDVAFTYSVWDTIECQVNDNEYKFLWDFLAFPSMNESTPNFETDEIIFLGYGIGDKRYSDYKGANVKGKTIMIYEGEPRNKNNISQVTKTEAESGWTSEKKLEYAQKKGVKMVFIIEDDIKRLLSENRGKVMGGQMELGDKRNDKSKYANHMYISSTIAKDLMGGKLKKVIKSRDKSKSKGKSKKEKRFTDEESREIKAALELIHNDPNLTHTEKVAKRKEYLSEYTRNIREGKYPKERKTRPTEQDKKRINEEVKSVKEDYKTKGEYARDQRNKTSYGNSIRGHKNKKAILERLSKKEKSAIKEYKQGKISEQQYLHYMDKITYLREQLEYRY